MIGNSQQLAKAAKNFSPTVNAALTILDALKKGKPLSKNELAKIAGTKYFVVELENYKRTPMEGIEIGLNNLKKLKF